MFVISRYEADNAKGDEKAPSLLGGRFRGYLVFDTGSVQCGDLQLHSLTLRKDYHYHWLIVINFAVMYNLFFVIGRSVFWELDSLFPRVRISPPTNYLTQAKCPSQGWLVVDYVSDAIYLLDLLVRMHEGYLDQGIMVKEAAMLRKNYRQSGRLKLDVLSVLPTDFAYFFFEGKCSEQVPCPVIFRLNRVARIDRMFEFFNKTESRTNFPNAFRITKVVLYILILIHWNACVFFAISFAIGFNTDTWVYQVQLALVESFAIHHSGQSGFGHSIHLQLLLVHPDVDNNWRDTSACEQLGVGSSRSALSCEHPQIPPGTPSSPSTSSWACSSSPPSLATSEQ